MGLLIALIGMVSIKLVVADAQTVVALGDLGDVKIWLSLAGLALTGSLLFHQVRWWGWHERMGWLGWFGGAIENT